MTVAAEPRIVKRRMDDFIWREKSASNRRLRSLLHKHFFKFDRVAVVGGMVRDFARVGQRGFSSDIDLVIEAPAEEVARLAQSTGSKANRFGGFSFTAEGWKVDFWALSTTWASREGLVEVLALEDIIRCTFFDWDSILYDLKERRVICDARYLDNVRSGTLDIKLLENPSITGCLYRAVKRIFLWDIEPGPTLKRFISDHLNDEQYAAIVREDAKRNKHPFLHKFGNVDILRAALDDREKRRRLSTAYAEQMQLPDIGAPLKPLKPKAKTIKNQEDVADQQRQRRRAKKKIARPLPLAISGG